MDQTPKLENLSADSCVLCSRKFNHEIENRNLLENVMKLYDLWDVEFTETTGDTFGRMTFEALNFCDECENLISNGIEYKRKFKVAKETVVKYVENIAEDNDAARKEFRNELESVIRTNRDRVERNNVNAADQAESFFEEDQDMLIPEVAFTEENEPVNIYQEHEHEPKVAEEARLLGQQPPVERPVPRDSRKRESVVRKREQGEEAKPAKRRNQETKPLAEGKDNSGKQESNSQRKDRIRFEQLHLKRSRLYKCFLCDEKRCSGISLRLHLQLAHREGNGKVPLQFKCPHCHKEFEKSVFDDLKLKGLCYCDHYGEKTVTMEGNPSCCPQPTFEGFADVHLRGCNGLWFLKPHSEDFKETCIFCPEYRSLDFEYFAHLRFHYEPDLSKLQACPLCQFQTSSPLKPGFLAHITRKHGLSCCGNQQYFCLHCNSVYKPLNGELESGRLVPEEYPHFRNFAREHTDCRRSEKETEFSCKWCSEVLESPKDLITHESTVHTKNLAFKCGYCDLKFVDRLSLNAHERYHVKKHVCKHCNESYAQKSRLDAHIASAHTGERNFVCEECGAAFYSLGNLNDHKQSHNTTRNYPCPQCGKLFKSRKDAQGHVYQVHKIQRKSAKKPRVCPPE